MRQGESSCCDMRAELGIRAVLAHCYRACVRSVTVTLARERACNCRPALLHSRRCGMCSLTCPEHRGPVDRILDSLSEALIQKFHASPCASHSSLCYALAMSPSLPKHAPRAHSYKARKEFYGKDHIKTLFLALDFKIFGSQPTCLDFPGLAQPCLA